MWDWIGDDWRWLIGAGSGLIGAGAGTWAAYAAHKAVMIASAEKPPVVSPIAEPIASHPGWFNIRVHVKNREVIPLLLEGVTLRDRRVTTVMPIEETLDHSVAWNPPRLKSLPIADPPRRSYDFMGEVNAADAPSSPMYGGGNGSGWVINLAVHFDFQSEDSDRSELKLPRSERLVPLKVSFCWRNAMSRRREITSEIMLPSMIRLQIP